MNGGEMVLKETVRRLGRALEKPLTHPQRNMLKTIYGSPRKIRHWRYRCTKYEVRRGKKQQQVEEWERDEYAFDEKTQEGGRSYGFADLRRGTIENLIDRGFLEENDDGLVLKTGLVAAYFDLFAEEHEE